MSLLHRVRELLRKFLILVRERGPREASRLAYERMRYRRSSVPVPAPLALTAEAALSFYQRRALQIQEQPQNNAYPKVSILVLTYNNLLMNQVCLLSIYCNTSYPNFEIIVVDNASADGTPAWLQSFAPGHPNLKLILNQENRGFSAGNNQAAREADGDYLIFLNNDTIVTPGWVERLLAHFQADPKIGLVGPVTNSTGNEARIPIDYDSPTGMEEFAARLAHTMSGRFFDIRSLAFFCVLARRDQFFSLGCLDERFGVGMFEDEDLAIRYQQAGLRVVCAEDVFIHHFWRAAFGQMEKDRYDRLFEENRRKFEEKWGREWQPYQARAHLFAPVPASLASSQDILLYRCNICGRSCQTPFLDLGRETRTCTCGSTVRSRAIIHLLSMELFGHSLALPDFPRRPDLRGWGLSDNIFPRLLSRKIGYVNTFFHKQPRFDISAPLEPRLEGTLDFLISADVFEHVVPPVSRAFENARRLLKPSGVLILTVPYTLKSAAIEHFPELYQYELVRQRGRSPRLKNTTRDGREQWFDGLVFHGSRGATLEMRIFSQAGLISELQQAGFGKVRIASEPYRDYGIYWHDSWSLPVIARPG